MMSDVSSDDPDPQRMRKMVGISDIEGFIPASADDEMVLKKRLKGMKVRSAWEKIMPQEVLDHTDNVFVYDDGDVHKMVVYTDSALWAAELETQRYIIGKKMGEALKERIDSVEFHPSAIGYSRRDFMKEIEARPSYREDVPSISLSEPELDEIYKQAEKIEDEELKKSLIKARIKDEEWKKGIKGFK